MYTFCSWTFYLCTKYVKRTDQWSKTFTHIISTAFSYMKLGQRIALSGYSMQVLQAGCPFSHPTSTTTQQQPFYGRLSGTTGVSRYQKKHSPTNHPDHHKIFISFFHLPRSTASSLLKLRAWQSFCTTSLHVLFGLPLGLEPSTSYSIHFLPQSVSSFCNTCPYHRNLFCCSINIISSIPSLSLNSLLGTLSFTLKVICNGFSQN